MNRAIILVSCLFFLNQCSQLYASSSLPLKQCDFALMPGVTNVLDNNDRTWMLMNGHLYLRNANTWYEGGMKWELMNLERNRYGPPQRVNWYNKKEFADRLYYASNALKVRDAMAESYRIAVTPPPLIGIKP